MDEANYGLYSYAIIVNKSARSLKFINDIRDSTQLVETIDVPRPQINILYISVSKQFALKSEFTKSDYGFQVARILLDKICSDPPDQLRDICVSDLSGGPYVVTYAKPIGSLTKIPPPLLFVDMSDINQRAFSTLLACYKTQVKRDDFSDMAKINTLKNRILSVILTAADWTAPIKGSLTSIIYMLNGRKWTEELRESMNIIIFIFVTGFISYFYATLFSFFYPMVDVKDIGLGAVFVFAAAFTSAIAFFLWNHMANNR
jgi:hypothetical protein